MRQDLTSIFVACAVLAAVGCRGTSPDVSKISRARVHASLSAGDGEIIANQQVDTRLQIQGLGKVARANYFGDDGASFAVWGGQYYVENWKARKNPSCDAYVGRSGDVWDTGSYSSWSEAHYVKYDKIPEVFWEGSIKTDGVNVDGSGHVEQSYVVANGKWTSEELRDSCTLTDVSFRTIDSSYFEISLEATEEVCHSYCGVKVREYCSSGCSQAGFFYASGGGSCNSDCAATETPFCQDSCVTKKHLLANASIYGSDIVEASPKEGASDADGASASADAQPTAAISDDGTVLELNLDMKLEPYIPLNY